MSKYPTYLVHIELTGDKSIDFSTDCFEDAKKVLSSLSDNKNVLLGGVALVQARHVICAKITEK